VTSIGNYAFEGCTWLKKVIVPDIAAWCGISFNVSSANPLYYAHHLYSDKSTEITELVIPDGVTSIKSDAFSGCSGLTSVTIPNSVTSIESYAFYNCSGLTSIEIPNSVTNIGNNAFSGCSKLKKVIAPDIAAWCGISFNVSSANPLYYAHHLYSDDNTEITELVIPDGVTSIGASAFSGCSGLTSVEIPNSVTSIGGYAFESCSGLTLVECNVGKAFNISSNTFSSDTYNNAELRVPRDLSSMYKQAEGWKNFKSITEGDLRICGNNLTYTYSEALGKITIQGTGAMYDYSSSSPAPWNSYKGDIITIVIEDGATSVGSDAFSDCNSLYSVTFGKDVKTVGSSAFSGCSGLQKVIAPDIAAWCGIEFGNETANPLYYAHHLYSDKSTEITELVIPNSVTSIGQDAFSGCSGLTSVTIGSGVTSIGQDAFSGCSELTSVTIGSGVTNIGQNAFSGCSGLTSVTINSNAILSKTYTSSSNLSNIFGSQVQQYIIGNSVTSIGERTFYNCSGLTSITIPTSVTSIGGSAFYGCSGLTSITIPNNVTSIGDWAFYGCSGLTSITIPNNVTSIGDWAFYGCSGLTSVTIPNSVTSIGWSAFRGCSGLTSVTIPNSVTSIGWSAFYGCSGLTSITIPNSVTSIGEYAFNGCSGLTSITIPNSVTSIGDGAFKGCSGLTSIDIPNSVTSIGQDAFSGCSKLKKVIAPDIAAWCGINFGDVWANPLYNAHHLYSDDNTEITELVIPDGVTSIGASAFSGCSGLTSVTIGSGVTSIGQDAFSGCSGLTSVTLHCNNVGTWFKGLTSIKEVVIGSEVTSIGQDAFSGCSGLTSVTFHCNNVGTWFSGKSSIKEVWIEKEVTSIAQQSFAGCSGLQSVYNNAEDVFTIAKNTFDDATYSSATLYVPTGMKATYEDTPWWLNFNKKEEYDFPTGITTPQQSKDVKVVDAYQINGLKTGSKQKGLNILRMSDGTIRKVVK